MEWRSFSVSPTSELFYPPGQSSWTEEDITFVVHKLAEQRPDATPDIILSAVKSATCFFPAVAGRVKLMQRASERLQAK